MEPKQLFYSILANDEAPYKGIKFEDLKSSAENEILLLLIKQVFFYGDKKFKNKKIKEKMKNHEWIKSFIEDIISLYLFGNGNDIIYEMIIEYFCSNYENIKKYFKQFIKEIEKIKTDINFDLFEIAICFLCHLNGNNKFLDIISNLKENNNFKDMEIFHDEVTKKDLYQLVTEYCILYKYPTILPEDFKKKYIEKESIMHEIKIFKCYADLCPISTALKNFILTLYSCLKNGNDLRINKEKNVADFIEELFILIALHLKIPDYWKDENISIITSDIYKISFKYCTENFDSNYIDFVICYITHYEIPAEEFMHYFLRGLNEDEFNLTFKNCQLKEKIGNINDKSTITKLINKIYKRKINDPKSLNNGNKSSNGINNDNMKLIEEHQKQNNEIIIKSETIEGKNTNNFKEKNSNKIEPKKDISKAPINQEENKDIISITENPETSNFSGNKNNLDTEIIAKDSKEPQNNTNINEKNFNIKNEIEIHEDKNDQKIELIEKTLKEELEKLREENKSMKETIYKLQGVIDKLQGDIDKLQGDIDKLQGEKESMKKRINILEDKDKSNEEEKMIMKNDYDFKAQKQAIVIKQLNQQMKEMALTLERISFRDLSKIVFNYMINLVNKKNVKLLEGLKKRKEKLNKINEEYNFKDIEFMREPFKKICERYYISNTRSHLPDIADNMKKKPIGLITDRAGEILKRYHEAMIGPKRNDVLYFLANECNLKNEIRILYL